MAFLRFNKKPFMKKTYFLMGAIMTSTFAFAQQPNNPSFETWENTGTDNEEPTNWSAMMTGDLCTFCVFGASQRVSQEDIEVYDGTFSARIKSTAIGAIIVNGTMTTGRVTAPTTAPSDGYNQTLTGNSNFNHPFTHEPDSLVFWAKYNLTVSSDSARVSFVLHDDYDLREPQDAASEAHVIASARTNFQTGNAWERISIPFEYTWASSNPVSYLLATFTSSYVPGEGNGNATLYVDGVEFIYNTVTSIADVVANVSVFPNPSLDGRFTVDLGSINGDVELVVYDLYGRIVQTQYEAGGNQVNMEIKANSGMYLLSVNTGSTREIIRVVKR